MEKIKLNTERYQIKDETLCATMWQEEAKNAISEFKIKFPQDKRIFALAKKNYQYFKAKVNEINEKMARENNIIAEYNERTKYKPKKLKEKSEYAGLLIYLLKK